MTQSDPLWRLLEDLAATPGLSDITFASDGRFTVRREGRLSVGLQPWLKDAWSATVQALGGVAGRSTWIAENGGRRLRVSHSRHRAGCSLSIRPIARALPTREELMLPYEVVRRFASLEGGLVLIAGPTGSGKTTTVSALLRERSRARGGKYITLEDPVEYLHSDGPQAFFEQRELGVDVSSYAEGLKEALHMNPDVIAVQEIRDGEAASTALSAALSGHLVVASMHAYSASTAAQRFLSILNPSMEDLGARDALACCLETVLVQRLMPGHGRLVPVFEIMNFRDDGGRLSSMERLLRCGNWNGLRQEMEVGRRAGMQTLEDALGQLRQEGLLA